MHPTNRLPVARFAPLLSLVLACDAPARNPSQGRTYAVEASLTQGRTYELDRYLNIRGNSFSGFSHDGKWVYFLSAVTGTAQVWRAPVEGGWPEQVTWWNERVQRAAPSPASDSLLVSRDMGGNENSQLYLVSGDGSEVKNLTNAPDVKHDFGGWSWDGKRIAFASNARTQADVLAWRAAKKEGKPVGDEPLTSNDVYVLTIGGEAEMVWRAEPGELFSAAGFSPDGTRLLVSRSNGSLDNDLFVLDLTQAGVKRSLTHLTPHQGVAHYDAEWIADGSGLWCIHNEGREFAGLFRWDLASGKREAIRTPEADVETLAVSRDGRTLAIGTAKNGGREIEILDVKSMRGRVLETGFGVPGGIDFFEGAGRIGYTMVGPADPSDVFVADLASRETTRVTRAFLAGIPRESLAVPRAVKYTSFDGTPIEALLYEPVGRGPHPTIVDFHGGPEGQHRPLFNALTQYFCSRGYAVFQPNVRGSTGYGRTFTHLDDVRNRELSVHDGAAGVQWLKAQGLADPKRIAALGGSYGGYMVLASLTLHPDLWAAGVDVVGIANFVTFLENTSGYRRKLRESEYGVAGTAAAPGPDRAFLTEISPIHRVERIRAPLLVIHGEQDPRVPVGEARQIEAALRSLGRPVQSLYYPDEGHGIAKLKNRLDCYPKVVEFLDAHLGRKPSP